MLEKHYNSCPDGKITIAHCGNSFKWFYNNNNEQRYLKKSERPFAEQLAIKKYIKLKMNVLETELSILKKLAPKYYCAQQAINKLLEDPAYMELLSNYFKQENEEASIWMNAPYPRNMRYPQNLIHQTIGNLKVRSKSESIIAMSLSENGIPYRYENIITLEGIELSPDFTIMHPVTGEIYYWEHFGMMDDSNYVYEFANKIKLYARNNIILGENLICTFESKNNPLSYSTISNTINQYFG